MVGTRLHGALFVLLLALPLLQCEQPFVNTRRQMGM
jgi:hypothetical protein